MKFEPVKVVKVYYKPYAEKVFVGRLALKGHKIIFEYAESFVSSGIEISPFKLPLQHGLITSSDFVFGGLFGVFNDSLPDGWGRLLLDRALAKHNISPHSLSLLDRLCFVGSSGMGALIYEPEVSTFSQTLKKNLDEIADEISEFQQNEYAGYVEELLALSGYAAGARPKVIEKNWLIKFPAVIDPKDIGAIEYAYHKMAGAAGIDVPEVKLFPSYNGYSFFGSLRFDRGNLSRVHMHTISGLLHADHRMPSLDYEAILKATQYLTCDIKECEKQFRVCVFNIISHNRDDHAKNFSFLMDDRGKWKVSPSYDLTFSSGPNSEHCSMVMGEGEAPGISDLLNLAKVVNIKKEKALQIIDEVKSAVMMWDDFASSSGVGDISTSLISKSINKIIKERF